MTELENNFLQSGYRLAVCMLIGQHSGIARLALDGHLYMKQSWAGSL